MKVIQKLGQFEVRLDRVAAVSEIRPVPVFGGLNEPGFSVWVQGAPQPFTVTTGELIDVNAPIVSSMGESAKQERLRMLSDLRTKFVTAWNNVTLAQHLSEAGYAAEIDARITLIERMLFPARILRGDSVEPPPSSL